MDHKRISVAVVGGGVQGLMLLYTLMPHADVTLFETSSSIGGVWNNYKKVPYMSLQLSSRHFRFPSFPHPKSLDMPSAAYILQYIKDFATEKKLWNHIRLNTPVTFVDQPRELFCRLFCRHRSLGEFNFVVYTGTATIPNIPAQFHGRSDIIHSSGLSRDKLDKLRGMRCLVIGGSKSAAEIVVAVKKQNVASVVWVARRFNTFAKFHPKTTLSIKDIFKAVPSLITKRDTGVIFPLKVLGDDPYLIGSGNVLTIDQYETIKQVDATRDAVLELRGKVAHMKSGRKLRFDFILLGTGYRENKVTGHEACNDRFVFSASKFKKKLNITSFGIANSHINSIIIRDYIVGDVWKTQSCTTFSQNYMKLKHLLWQIYYLMSDGAVPSVDTYSSYHALLVILVLIAVIICFVCILIKRNRNKQSAR